MWACINMQKNQAILMICSGESCNLIGWEHFGPYLRNKNFPKYWICAGTQLTKFFNKFKKPCFWPIFPNFGTKTFFLENPALSCTTSYGFLALCQNSEKTNDTIPRKHQDRRTDERTEGRKDGQTLFYRTLLATTRGPKKKSRNWLLIC